jgi:predicted transcriptional regulator
MEQVWSHGPADVKAVHATIGPVRRITLNTVQSTMERLYRKGQLAREKVSHAYVYSARLSRQEAQARILQDVVTRVVGSRPDAVLAAFIDLAARAGEETLDELQRLIAERRARPGGGTG